MPLTAAFSKGGGENERTSSCFPLFINASTIAHNDNTHTIQATGKLQFLFIKIPHLHYHLSYLPQTMRFGVNITDDLHRPFSLHRSLPILICFLSSKHTPTYCLNNFYCQCWIIFISQINRETDSFASQSHCTR